MTNISKNPIIGNNEIVDYLLDPSNLQPNIYPKPTQNQSYYNIGLWVVIGGGILALFIGLGISLKVWLSPETLVTKLNEDNNPTTSTNTNRLTNSDLKIAVNTTKQINPDIHSKSDSSAQEGSKKTFKKLNFDEIPINIQANDFLNNRYADSNIAALNEAVDRFELFYDILESGRLDKSKLDYLNKNSGVKDVIKFTYELTKLKNEFNSHYINDDHVISKEEIKDIEDRTEKLCLQVEKGLEFLPKILETNNIMKSVIGDEAKIIDEIQNLYQVQTLSDSLETNIKENLNEAFISGESLIDMIASEDLKVRLGIQEQIERLEAINGEASLYTEEFYENKRAVLRGSSSTKFLNELGNLKNKLNRSNDILNYVLNNLDENLIVMKDHAIAKENWEKANQDLQMAKIRYSDDITENLSNLNFDNLEKPNRNTPDLVSEHATLDDYIDFAKNELEETEEITSQLEWKADAMIAIVDNLDWIAAQKQDIANNMEELKTLLNQNKLSQEKMDEVNHLLENYDKAMNFKLPDISSEIQINLDINPFEYIDQIFESHIDVSFDEVSQNIDDAISIVNPIDNINNDYSSSDESDEALLSLEKEEFLTNHQSEEALKEVSFNPEVSSGLDNDNDHDFKL